MTSCEDGENLSPQVIVEAIVTDRDAWIAFAVNVLRAKKEVEKLRQAGGESSPSRPLLD